jgi:hypothetical protein
MMAFSYRGYLPVDDMNVRAVTSGEVLLIAIPEKCSCGIFKTLQWGIALLRFFANAPHFQYH